MSGDGNSDTEPTRRRYVTYAGTLVAGGLLAGCSGQSESPATAAPTATETVPSTATADTTPGATVQVRSHPELGDILVDAEGMTLYMYDADTQGSGSSTCHDSCATAWPPLTVDGDVTGDDVTAELTTFARSNGATQVAANGWPLYYWVDDGEPGDATGQGVNDVWWVLTPDGTPVRSDTTTA